MLRSMSPFLFMNEHLGIPHWVVGVRGAWRWVAVTSSLHPRVFSRKSRALYPYDISTEHLFQKMVLFENSMMDFDNILLLNPFLWYFFKLIFWNLRHFPRLLLLFEIKFYWMGTECLTILFYDGLHATYFFLGAQCNAVQCVGVFLKWRWGVARRLE